MTTLAHNADSLVVTLTAVNPDTGDQTTTWTYGSTVTESDIAATTLIRQVTFPDGGGDQIAFAYNRAGEVKQTTDQLGTVHTLLYDKLARLIHDCVTTLGTGVDGAVRRLSVAYEVRGMLQSIASYDNATVGSGAALDEVFFEFDSLGNPTREYQEHKGLHDDNSLFVGYNFD